MYSILYTRVLEEGFVGGGFISFGILTASLYYSIIVKLVSFTFLGYLSCTTSFEDFFPLYCVFLPMTNVIATFMCGHVNKGSSVNGGVVVRDTGSNRGIPGQLTSLAFVFAYVARLFNNSINERKATIRVNNSLADGITSCLNFGGGSQDAVILDKVDSTFNSIFNAPFTNTFFKVRIYYINELSTNTMVPYFTYSCLTGFIARLLNFGRRECTVSSVPSFSTEFLFIFLVTTIYLNLVNGLFTLKVGCMGLTCSGVFGGCLLTTTMNTTVIDLLVFTLKLGSFRNLDA